MLVLHYTTGRYETWSGFRLPSRRDVISLEILFLVNLTVHLKYAMYVMDSTGPVAGSGELGDTY